MLSGGGKKETVSPERRIAQVAEGGKGVLAWFYLVVVGKDGKTQSRKYKIHLNETV
jgi:hypothetical protein